VTAGGQSASVVQVRWSRLQIPPSQNSPLPHWTFVAHDDPAIVSRHPFG
jgi:hypothetical protein